MKEERCGRYSFFAGLWCGACMNSIVLIIDRLLEVSNKHMIQMEPQDNWNPRIGESKSVPHKQRCCKILLKNSYEAWKSATDQHGHKNRNINTRLTDFIRAVKLRLRILRTQIDLIISSAAALFF
ncbi:hypothetical protein KIN20_001698 [Parelaphostrongylus tenuis]|uniref:Uncharacterized protein n=1 Tax=Parelaphostrongylus tenuis TaxID=148309 RepID=A0AAD5MMJ1_PARTN|nr:hypothetical protein KIN20_001698 [Parelaphostrongylus tenuis]